jgi:hypothetical protein
MRDPLGSDLSEKILLAPYVLFDLTMQGVVTALDVLE